MEQIMDTLETQDIMCAQMAAAYNLSTPPTNEVYIGEFPLKLFTEPEPLAVLAQFSEDVKQIGEEITER